MIPIEIGKPLTVEARYIDEKRKAILRWAGKRWALHPANATQRQTPPPEVQRG